ncbi:MULTISPECIES: zinc-binding dehydrogenase [unclassified Aeromicrobium]|uniref:zinc-binding dehydrogenase n=1 Tax=unclassified Aeromicrobium TaxID=2633570 RepID=UPI00396B3FB2
MRATVLTAPGRVGLEERPDPVVLERTDAVVEVVAAAVCGSDLWWLRGDNAFDEPRRMGHEFVGRVVSVGSAVALSPGDFVLSAFKFGDSTCSACREGFTSNCAHGGHWGAVDDAGRPLDEGQGELVRVPLADGTLVRVDAPVTEELLPHLLALTDVMATGVHAARCAGVVRGADAVVIGDGAVGLCAVAACRREGARHVTILSRNPDRLRLARLLGADEVIEVRGEEAVRQLRATYDGGPAHVLECVGTSESLATAIEAARVGGQIGMVGIPHGDNFHPRQLFAKNLGLRAGGAPARALLDELLPEVLAGTLRPGVVFDRQYDLADVARAYGDMADRRTTKALLRVSPLD